MTCYSYQLRDQIVVKSYGILSVAKIWVEMLVKT